MIRNANHYYDEQLIEAVESMTKQANIQLYKSNQRTIRDEEWRHSYGRRSAIPDGLDCYKLEYRIVLEHMGGINTNAWGWDKERYAGLDYRAAEYIEDLLVVAQTLGWNTNDTIKTRGHSLRSWESNKLEEFISTNGKQLMDVRAFKKGTLHIRFNQQFIKKLNVEFGRLKGWLKDKHQAAQETGITLEEATQFFNSTLQLGVNTCVLLLTQANADVANLPTGDLTETFSLTEAIRMGAMHEDAFSDEEFFDDPQLCAA